MPKNGKATGVCTAYTSCNLVSRVSPSFAQERSWERIPYFVNADFRIFAGLRAKWENPVMITREQKTISEICFFSAPHGKELATQQTPPKVMTPQ